MSVKHECMTKIAILYNVGLFSGAISSIFYKVSWGKKKTLLGHSKDKLNIKEQKLKTSLHKLGQKRWSITLLHLSLNRPHGRDIFLLSFAVGVIYVLSLFHRRNSKRFHYKIFHEGSLFQIPRKKLHFDFKISITCCWHTCIVTAILIGSSKERDCLCYIKYNFWEWQLVPVSGRPRNAWKFYCLRNGTFWKVLGAFSKVNHLKTTCTCGIFPHEASTK